MGFKISSIRSYLLTVLLASVSIIIASPVMAGQPRCFMHGIISPTPENNEKASISDMIRLHFDADNKKKCEDLMHSYCVHNVRNKDYSPIRLKGSFKPDVEKNDETNYTFSEKCKLQSDEE